MKRLSLLIITLLFMTLLLPFTAAAWWPFSDDEEEGPVIGTVPTAAWELSQAMNMQLARRFSQDQTAARNVTLIITTPVELRGLDSSSPLARQMSEEMAGWFAEAGYSIQEIRLAKSIIIRENTGEIVLTRDLALMASNKASSNAVLTGTYTVTPRNVRFNMQIIHTGTNSVLAKGSVTIPITQELRPLLADLTLSRTILPSAGTRLGN